MRRKSKIILVLAIASVLVITAWSFWKIDRLRGQAPMAADTVLLSIGSSRIYAEVASAPEEREHGLSYRDSLGEHEGMLFQFAAPGKYGFWMKGMLFPLDFIYARDGRIVEIKENVSPSAIPVPFFPAQSADAVIEVNAGWISRNGIKVGDEAAILSR